MEQEVVTVVAQTAESGDRPKMNCLTIFEKSPGGAESLTPTKKLRPRHLPKGRPERIHHYGWGEGRKAPHRSPSKKRDSRGETPEMFREQAIEFWSEMMKGRRILKQNEKRVSSKLTDFVETGEDEEKVGAIEKRKKVEQGSKDVH